MKPVFGLPKPLCVALFPSGSRGSAVPAQGRSCWVGGPVARVGRLIWDLALCLSHCCFLIAVSTQEPCPMLCRKLGNCTSSCRTAWHSSLGSMVGEVGLMYPMGGSWRGVGVGGGCRCRPCPGLSSCVEWFGTSTNANSHARSSSAQQCWEWSLHLCKIKSGCQAMSLFCGSGAFLIREFAFGLWILDHFCLGPGDAARTQGPLAGGFSCITNTEHGNFVEFPEGVRHVHGRVHSRD